MEFFRKESAVVKAWIICTAVVIGLAYLPAPDGQAKVEFGVWSATLGLALSVLMFSILRFFAGKARDSRKPPYKKEPINTWGYSWRFFVAYFITFSIGVIPIMLVKDLVPVPIEVLSTILLIVLFSLFCLVFYCPNRRERLTRLKDLFRPTVA